LRRAGNSPDRLPLLREIANRAAQIHAAGDSHGAVLHPLNDARRLPALRAGRGLRNRYVLCAISCFRFLSHWRLLLSIFLAARAPNGFAAHGQESKTFRNQIALLGLFVANPPVEQFLVRRQRQLF
jgi:hypothetical protein